MFNSNKCHLIIKRDNNKVEILDGSDKTKIDDQGVGISGEYLSKGSKRVMVISNSYEDPRFNPRVDIGVSN